MPYVRTVPYHEATGDLKAMYDEALQARGQTSNVMSVNSIRPSIMRTLQVHNMNVMGSESGLTAAEKQMIATVVSALNKCQY